MKGEFEIEYQVEFLKNDIIFEKIFCMQYMMSVGDIIPKVKQSNCIILSIMTQLFGL